MVYARSNPNPGRPHPALHVCPACAVRSSGGGIIKANSGKGNNQSRDHWETPQWLFDELKNQYPISYDCCASEANKKCGNYSGDFLKVRNIKRIAWMNPPFSQSEIMFKHFFQVVEKGVAIYRCDNLETKIWQNTIFPKADWVFVPNKRISYEGEEGLGSRFPSALIGVGVDPPRNLDGTILLICGVVE